jgi:hypothetical protein
VIENPDTDTTAVVTVEKTLDGTVISAEAAITKKAVQDGNNSTAILSGIVVEQIIEAAGQSDVAITVTAADDSGTGVCTFKVNAADLSAGTKLLAYVYDTDENYYSKASDLIYTVSENGDLSVSLPRNASWELLSEDEVQKISWLIVDEENTGAEAGASAQSAGSAGAEAGASAQSAGSAGAEAGASAQSAGSAGAEAGASAQSAGSAGAEAGASAQSAGSAGAAGGAETANVAETTTSEKTKLTSKNTTIKLSKDSCTYSGKAQKPTVKGLNSKGKTIQAKYYTVTYKNNTKVGKATVTIKFKGKYTGTIKATYTIKLNATSFTGTSAKTDRVTMIWKKQTKQVTGYQIQYATDSKFTKNKTTILLKGAKKSSETITGLSGKTKYYFRIRTYKTVNGKKYYSVWSKAQAVKTK